MDIAPSARRALPWIALLGLLLHADIRAMFLLPEVEQVPIARVLTNQSGKLSRDPNNFQITCQVARLHSMMYATNLAVVTVEKNTGILARHHYPSSGIPREVSTNRDPRLAATARAHLTNAIALYQRSLVLMRRSTNAYPDQIVRAELGLAWCLDQSGDRPNALAAYRQALQSAWKIEVTGDFSFTEWLRGAWEDIKSGQNPLHARPRGSIGPEGSLSDEIIGYLLRLLDPRQAAAEIADLKRRQQTLLTVPRYVTPILIPLEPETPFESLVDPHADVAFDLDGSGLPRRWGWITPRAAWLVYDARDTGRITSGLQLFGNVTFWIFWSDGYAALAALDDNADGQLAGPELQHLALWHDGNSDGVSDPGEVRPVTAFGIRALACRAEPSPHGFPWNPAGVRFQDGSTRPTYDWIAPSPGEGSARRNEGGQAALAATAGAPGQLSD